MVDEPLFAYWWSCVEEGLLLTYPPRQVPPKSQGLLSLRLGSPPSSSDKIADIPGNYSSPRYSLEHWLRAL